MGVNGLIAHWLRLEEDVTGILSCLLGSKPMGVQRSKINFIFIIYLCIYVFLFYFYFYF